MSQPTDTTTATCQWPDCDRSVYARGLCARDYARAAKANRLAEFIAPPRVCAHCGAVFATGSRGFNRFCSRDCQRASVEAERLAARAADLEGRTCAWCGTDLPTGHRSDAWHCSTTCQQAHWYAENEEHVQARTRAWRLANHDRRSESEHRRRARIYATAVGPIDYAAVWDRDGGCCWICEAAVDRSLRHPDPLSRSWDHVVPLIAGGTHTMDNVALSHLVCNTSKRAKVLDRKPVWAGEEVPDADESATLVAEPA